MKKDVKKGTFSFLLPFIKKYKWGFFGINALFLLGDGFQLFVSNIFLKNFINEATNGTITLNKGIIYGIEWIFATNLCMFTYLIIRKLKFSVLYRLKEDIRKYIFQHSLKQSNSFFNNNFVGSLNSKINDITSGTSAILDKIFDMFTNIAFFLAMSVVFFIKDWLLGTLFFGSFVIYCIVFYFLSKKQKELSEIYYKEESECSGKIIDCFTNILNIKVFSTKNIEKANIARLAIRNLKNSSKVQFYKGLLDAACGVFRVSLLSGVFFVSLNLLLTGKINIGEMTTNVTMTMTIFWWLNWAVICFMDSVEAYGKVAQGVEALYVNPEIVDYPGAKKLIVNKGEIDFRDLNFQYKPDLPFVFKDMNLKIQPGQKVGLVGYSGSGKSSMISLLLRFYDVTAGGIYIDNQNIQTEVTQESLRDNISYIPQDPILFHRTIAENIKYGNFYATDEAMFEASKKACCDEFINELENGYDTLVGERGVKLSGGQRQRIAIARAILKNSPILILDEATSALDSLTEREIQTALKNLMENKTVIAVAHRLSTLNNMDRIIVLDKGKIIEDGTKTELLANNGLFKKMWDMQRDGILVEN